MKDFTFLTKEQVSGPNKLEILDKYDRAAITDFAILLGGTASDYTYTDEGDAMKNRAGLWWTSDIEEDRIYNVNCCGELCFKDNFLINTIGARPAIPYSSIKNFCKNAKRNENGVLEVEFGEYPQSVIGAGTSTYIEFSIEFDMLIRAKLTNKRYTSVKNNNGTVSEISHMEYEYKGGKYICFKCNPEDFGNNTILSNGESISTVSQHFLRVEPIVWLVDEKKNIAVSKKILFAGVPFHLDQNVKDFSKTYIKKFMNEYFSKEIIQGMNLYYAGNEIAIMNPYNFDYAEVTEEDIIKGSIESNIPVFLHGKSSEGKSARVKQLDKDLEIIYLRNATPESLNGKSVYNSETGEMIDIPPTWFKKITKKCEEEPNKLHIVFFDEITNALPSIQGMAFNIILDREVNGIWKLPKNARIVAAGNDLNDSLAANQLVEPLFNRFAHVYINTTSESWLKWAMTPKNSYERLDYEEKEEELTIHPAIYAYIAYNSYSKVEVLRTPYTGEKPNADPRKWEMASKVLYKTKKPEMLRSLIGNELTVDFVEFTKEQVITVEAVISGNYPKNLSEMDTSQKFATAVGLSSVDEEHVEIVRNFVKENLGEELRALFDTLWCHGLEERLEKISELELSKGEKVK